MFDVMNSHPKMTQFFWSLYLQSPGLPPETTYNERVQRQARIFGGILTVEITLSKGINEQSA